MSDALDHNLDEWDDSLSYRPPPEKSYISLSEAVTWIAFFHSVDNSKLSLLLGTGLEAEDFKYERNLRRDEAIKAAVASLVDLGMGGSVGFLGKHFQSVLDDERGIKTEFIPVEKFAEYRWFDTIDNSLYCVPNHTEGDAAIGLAWGEDRREIFHPDQRHYRFVTVNREALLREFPIAENRSQLENKSFDDSGRSEWIRSCPQMSADDAHKLFKVHPRYDGTKQAEFRVEWKQVRGTTGGRPRKKS